MHTTAQFKVRRQLSGGFSPATLESRDGTQVAIPECKRLDSVSTLPAKGVISLKDRITSSSQPT